MNNKGFISLITMVMIGIIVLGGGTLGYKTYELNKEINEVSVGAPNSQSTRNIKPFTDSTYEVGTDGNAYATGTFDRICLTDDSCQTTWGGGSGETNTMSNLGAGTDYNVFFQKSGVDFEMRSLTAGTNVTMATSGTAITISATAGSVAQLGQVGDVSTTSLSNFDVLYYNGSNWVPTATSTWDTDTNTTYTGGELLTLNGTEFDVNTVTLTDEKICTYEADTNALDCSYTDISGGGGGSGLWATSTAAELLIHPADVTDVVVIGNNATSTTGNIFEVVGDSLFDDITAVNASTTLSTVAGESWFDGAVNGIALDEIENLTTDKTINIGANSFVWRLAEANSFFGWNVVGGFSGNALQIQQTGDTGVGNLLLIKGVDPDLTMLKISHANASTSPAIVVESGTTDLSGGLVTLANASSTQLSFTTAWGNIIGNVTGNVTGNADTATALETARTIAGVSFDGTANISLNNNAITNGAGYNPQTYASSTYVWASDWTTIDNYPTGCTNQVVTAIGDTLTCNTVDVGDYTNLTVGATGIELSGDDIALTAGYNIPLTASSTNWNSFYDTPSGVITAGTGLSWSTNTLNAEVQTSDLHSAVTLAGQNYLTLSTQQITAGEIEPDDLAGSDFGDFTCNGTTCTSDATNTNLTTLANVTTVGTIGTGTWQGTAIDHERGGLEADVNAYSGLVAISGGSTSEVDAKSELEAQIADVADFCEADGDTYSGTHDYSGATVKVHTYPSFEVSTTTAWTGTTTQPLGPAFTAESWETVKCFTNTGTLNVAFNDGTNEMNLFNASTTVGTVTLSSNNTFTASEKRYVDIGTPASTPTSVTCSLDIIVNN